MNNWRDIKKEMPVIGTTMIRVKYVYGTASSPPWSPTFFDISCLGRINQTIPNTVNFSYHRGIGIVHIDPPHFDDNPLSFDTGGFRWSDLKGNYQRITHWMYLDEPYDESEETPDAVLLQDQDGNIIKSSERRNENGYT